MKNSILISAFAVVSLFCSCETLKQDVCQPEVYQEPKCSVTVSAGLPGAATKAVGVTEDANGEKKISNMQVFVFKGDLLMSYKQANSSSTSLECIPGERTIYVVVNAPDLSSIASKSQLLATVSDLSANTPANLVMIGSCTMILASGATVSVEVKRLAARVHLSGITRAFDSEKLRGVQMVIDKIYMVNAAKSINYGQTSVPSAWYNEGKNKSELPAILCDSVDESLANGSTNSDGHWFYIYPNDPQTSNKTTRIVIETTLGGQKCYYPINIPALIGNQSYEISKIKLTSPGGDNPDTPVKYENISFEFSVVDWYAVDVAELVS